MKNRFWFRIPFYNWDGYFIGFSNLDIEKGIEPYNYGRVYHKEYEQCTGLKDINGNFIYENDIVVWNDGGGEVELKPKEGHVRITRVQLFPDLHFKLVGGYPKGTYTIGEEFHFGNFIYKNTEKYLKIVGNIHENKELLDER